MLQHPEHQPQLTVMYTDSALGNLYEVLDQLHNAASEGRAEAISHMSMDDLRGMLQDIIYTAQETVAELDAHQTHPVPQLRILEKPSA